VRNRSTNSMICLAAILGVVGCGRTTTPASQSGSAARVDTAVNAPQSIDGFRRADLAFYAEFAYPEADEAEYYGSLDEALTGATAVVLGQVTGVRVTRLVGESATDAVPYAGITIRPVEVLRGSLPAEQTDALTVEFVTGGTEVDRLRTMLPGGHGIWVLRQKGEIRPGVTPKAQLQQNEHGYYRLVSSQGLFVQGESHVVNPLEHGDGAEIPLPGESDHGAPRRDPVIVAAETNASLSDLAAYVRSL
jgi:hypothetical protein